MLFSKKTRRQLADLAKKARGRAQDAPAPASESPPDQADGVVSERWGSDTASVHERTGTVRSNAQEPAAASKEPWADIADRGGGAACEASGPSEGPGKLSGLSKRRLRQRLSLGCPQDRARAPAGAAGLNPAASSATKQPGPMAPDRISALTGPAESAIAAPAEQRTAAAAQTSPAGGTPSPVPLEELYEGQYQQNAFGQCWVIRAAPETICAWGAEVGPAVEAFWGGEQSPDLPDPSPWLRTGAAGDPSAGPLLFLDIETGGLSSAPVFLAGFLEFHAGHVQIVQYLARDYAEEAALIAEVHRALGRCAALFTYNGAAFDLPFLADRAVYHSVLFTASPPHVDMLRLARRRCRDVLPNCKLQTLETHFCGRQRHDDIPPEQIPQTYHDFVRLGDGALLSPVLRHNQLDLLALLELVPHLYGPSGV